MVAHEDKNGWGVICDACQDAMVSPDGKYCMENILPPDNCELGGRIGGLMSEIGGYDIQMNEYASAFDKIE